MADCAHLTQAASPARGTFGEVDIPTASNEVPAQFELLRASRIRAALQGGRAHQRLKPAKRMNTSAPGAAPAASLLSDSSVVSGSIALAATLSGHLDQMRREDRLIDVVLVVQGHCFPCHRIVLAAWSGYFSHMFSGGWCEASKKEVALDSIPREGFDELLAFFYTGRIQVTAANATRLLQLASFLEINELEQATCEFLISRASNEVLLKLLPEHALASEHFRSECTVLLGRRLPEILTSPQETERERLLALPIERACDLLVEFVRVTKQTSSSMHALLQFVLEWAERASVSAEANASASFRADVKDAAGASSENTARMKTRALEQLLPVLPWYQMPPGELFDLVQTQPELLASPALRDLLQDATNFHTGSSYSQHKHLSKLKPAKQPAGVCLTAVGMAQPAGTARAQCPRQAQRTLHSPRQPAVPRPGDSDERSARRSKTGPWQGSAHAASPRRPRLASAGFTRLAGSTAAILAEPSTSGLEVHATASNHGAHGSVAAVVPAAAAAAAAAAAQARRAGRHEQHPRAGSVHREAKGLDRAAAAHRLQSAWRGQKERRRVRQLRVERLLARRRIKSEECVRRERERACVVIQSAARGRMDRFRGSAADVVELRGIRRDLAALNAGGDEISAPRPACDRVHTRSRVPSQRGVRIATRPLQCLAEPVFRLSARVDVEGLKPAQLVAQPLAGNGSMLASLRQKCAIQLQAAARRRAAMRRSAALRQMLLLSPAEAPNESDPQQQPQEPPAAENLLVPACPKAQEEPWACPLRLCKRRGCTCVLTIDKSSKGASK